jgi:hypothetical protein
MSLKRREKEASPCANPPSTVPSALSASSALLAHNALPAFPPVTNLRQAISQNITGLSND